MDKSRDAFRTISEVADWLGTPTHVLRFWESRFTQVKPIKRAGGRRYYRPADMELLGGIKQLLHDDGMTIRGVQKLLREEGVRHVCALSQPIDDDLAMGESPSDSVAEAPMAIDVPQMAEPVVDNVVPLTQPSAEPVDTTALGIEPIAPPEPIAPITPPRPPEPPTPAEPIAPAVPVQGDLLEETGLTPSQDREIDDTFPNFASEAPLAPTDPEAAESDHPAQNAEPSFGDHTPDFIQPDAPLDGADSADLSGADGAAPQEPPAEWMAPEPLLTGAPLDAGEEEPLSARTDEAAAADVWDGEEEDDLAQTSDFEDGLALDDVEPALDAPETESAAADAAFDAPMAKPAPIGEDEAQDAAPMAPPAPAEPAQTAQASEITADIPNDPDDDDDLPDEEFAALNALRGPKAPSTDQEALSAIYARLATLRARM